MKKLTHLLLTLFISLLAFPLCANATNGYNSSDHTANHDAKPQMSEMNAKMHTMNKHMMGHKLMMMGMKLKSMGENLAKSSDGAMQQKGQRLIKVGEELFMMGKNMGGDKMSIHYKDNKKDYMKGKQSEPEQKTDY